MPYSPGNNNPGGTFGISINGTMSPVVAGFTYNEQQPTSYGRIPTTLVVGVPLDMKAQTIQRIPLAERARQHRYHRQPRDVVGDPRLEATAQRRKDKAGIEAGLVLFSISFFRIPRSA